MFSILSEDLMVNVQSNAVYLVSIDKLKYFIMRLYIEMYIYIHIRILYIKKYIPQNVP